MKIPAPVSDKGLKWALLISAFIFWLYYVAFYGGVSKYLYSNFFYTSQYNNDKEKYYLKIHVPKNMADFVEQEIRFEGWSDSNRNKTLNLILKTSIYDSKFSQEIPVDGCNAREMNHPFIYITNQRDDNNSNDKVGTSKVLIILPPQGSSTMNLWIVIRPATSVVNNNCAVVQVLEVIDNYDSDDYDGDHSNCYKDKDKFVCPMQFEDNPTGIFVIKFNRNKTLSHFIIEKLLLPPWSNAILPTVIFALVWCFEPASWKEKNTKDIDEGKDNENKIQDTKTETGNNS